MSVRKEGGGQTDPPREQIRLYRYDDVHNVNKMLLTGYGCSQLGLFVQLV